MSGFQLTGLRLLSDVAPRAELPLKPGVNVISGPSDTGKSFAVECIDFMLGASDAPRRIPEADPYESLQLGLRRGDATEVTLQRPLSGGRFLVYETAFATDDRQTGTVLAEKHSPKNPHTISGFLLNLCGLWGKIILERLNGKKRLVSFRNLVPYFLIRENTIIRVSSPVFKEKNREETAELSVFRMLLTGRDDSSGAAPKVDLKVQKIRLSAQVDLIEEFIHRVEAELATIPSPADGEADLGAFEAMVRDEARLVEGLRQTISGIETERVTALRDAERIAYETEDSRSLLSRFNLLQEHYRSDLDRLDAINDIGSRLALLPGAECPLCGAPSENRMPNPDGIGTGPTPEEFRIACEAERKKIRAHELGLTMAIGDLEKRITLLDEETRKFTERIRRLEAASDAASQSLRQHSARLGVMIGRQAALERRAALEAQLAALQSSRAERVLPKTPAAGKQVERLLDLASELKAFCGFVRMLLDAWRFPDRGPVSFDLRTFDLTIGGKPRSSYGKGLRAITHAAFTIALQLYCRERGIAHPGPVILDSPLVTYRKRDVREGEALPDDIKNAFFEDLADRNRGEQVIIFDNEAPPDSVVSRIHAVFLDAADGSYPGGFLPPRINFRPTSG